MTTQHRVVRASTTDQRPSTDYATDVARIVCLSKGSPSEALQLCKQFRVADRVTDYFERAAVNPGVISDPGFAGDLVDPMPFAFLQSLQHKSVFDRVSQHSVQCPLNRHVAATTLVATGADAIEGEYKKISELEITGGKVPITKAACILVWDNALLKLGSPDALALIRRELTSGTSRATDETYLQLVTAGASSMAAGGNDLDSIRDGLRWMLQSVNTGAESKLFYVTSSPIAKALSIMGGDTGFAFPAMTPSGGFVGGVEVLVSDVVADDEVILISADQIAASTGSMGLSSASHATLRMSTTPESETGLSSLWQGNKTALRVERWYGAVPLRSDCAAVLTGLDLEGTV